MYNFYNKLAQWMRKKNKPIIQAPITTIQALRYFLPHPIAEAAICMKIRNEMK